MFYDTMHQTVLKLQMMNQVPATDAARVAIINEFKKVKEPFKEHMADHALETAKTSRADVYDHMARQGVEMKFTEFNPMTSRQIRLHSFEASDLTMDRMTGDVMGNLTQSYKEGLGIKETAARLESQFQNMRDYELKRIARTETNAAASLGAHYTMEKLDVEYEQWWTAGDDRVRDQHIWMHGQITKVGDNFSNGLAHPHDRMGPIEEWINCRCRPLPYLMPHGYTAPTGRSYFYEDEIVLRAVSDEEDLLKAENLDKLKAELAAMVPSERVDKVDKYFTQVADNLRRKGLNSKQVAAKMMDYNYTAQQPSWMAGAEAWAKTAPTEWGLGAVHSGQHSMITGQLKGQITKGTKWLSQKVHPNVIKYADSPNLHIAPKQLADGKWHRANYHPGSKMINWSGNGGSRTFIHEYGHHLHDQNPANRQVLGSYFRRKIEGEDIKRIYAGMEEWGYRDKFYDLYSGKVYGGNLAGDEILSRGLEEMSVNPARFLDKAPSHFNIVYAVMRGLF